MGGEGIHKGVEKKRDEGIQSHIDKQVKTQTKMKQRWTKTRIERKI